MKARVLTLPFDDQAGRFEDSALREFLVDKELVELRDHFFIREGQPFLTVVLTYRALGDQTATRRKREPAGRESWRQLLKPEEVPLFNSLREWRGEKAKATGVPPYVICKCFGIYTNKRSFNSLNG